jgi:hypothetical protein
VYQPEKAQILFLVIKSLNLKISDCSLQNLMHLFWLSIFETQWRLLKPNDMDHSIQTSNNYVHTVCCQRCQRNSMVAAWFLKRYKFLFCVTLYFSPRINSHYLTGCQDLFLKNRYRVYADTGLLRHVLSEFPGLTLPIFIYKRTVWIHLRICGKVQANLANELSHLYV